MTLFLLGFSGFAPVSAVVSVMVAHVSTCGVLWAVHVPMVLAVYVPLGPWSVADAFLGVCVALGL